MSLVPRGAVVVLADRAGRYTGKPRPAVVLQSEAYSETDSLLVVLLTSVERDAPLLRVPIPASASTGLDQPSWAMVDKLTAVARAQASRVIGQINEQTMQRIRAALLPLLGF